jgi:hypothetical protein
MSSREEIARRHRRLIEARDMFNRIVFPDAACKERACLIRISTFLHCGLENVPCACGRQTLSIFSTLNFDCQACCAAVAGIGNKVLLLYHVPPLRVDIRRIMFRKAMASWTAGYASEPNFVVRSASDVILLMSFISSQIYNILAPDDPAIFAPERSCEEQINLSIESIVQFLGSATVAPLLRAVLKTRMDLGAFGKPGGTAAEIAAEAASLLGLMRDHDALLRRFDQCLRASLYCHMWVVTKLQVAVDATVTYLPGDDDHDWHRFSGTLIDRWADVRERFVTRPFDCARNRLLHGHTVTENCETLAEYAPGLNANDKVCLAAAFHLITIAAESCVSATTEPPVADQAVVDELFQNSSQHRENNRNFWAMIGLLAWHYGKTYLRASRFRCGTLTPDEECYQAALALSATDLRHGALLREAILVELGDCTTVSVGAVDMFSGSYDVDYHTDDLRPLFAGRREQAAADGKLQQKTIALTFPDTKHSIDSRLAALRTALRP